MWQRSAVARRVPLRDGDAAPRVTKDAIVAIASRLFQERGYHATSLEQVARELGVTRPALYYYFRSKQDLLYEITGIAQARLVAGMQDAFLHGLRPAEAIRRLLFNHTITVLENAESVACFFQEESALPMRRRNQMRKTRLEYTKAFADMYAAGVKQGELLDVDPLMATFLMLGACNWVCNWYKPGAWTPSEIADVLNRMVLDGLLVRASQSPE